ncbi:MAG: CsbD family protein [Luteolibacter sp.]|jgi:uncharacterized protein YjbJ (UPF0337 family)
MNKQQIKGNWNVLKGRLKKAYADLTDDDLKHAEGNLDELVGIIQQRVGRRQEEIRREVEDMLR